MTIRILHSFRQHLTDSIAIWIAANKFWHLFSGPVTLYVILKFLEPEEQGIYYTFFSLLAATTIFELGLHVAIINFTSRTWEGLSINHRGEIDGNTAAKQNLSALVGFSIFWYGLISILFFFLALTLGTWFLRAQNILDGEILFAWKVAAFGGGLQLFLLSLFSILEGCQQLHIVSKYKLAQAILDTIILIICLVNGLGILSISILILCRCLMNTLFLYFRYGKFFSNIFVSIGKKRFSESKELIQMQWKLALQAIAGYLSVNLYVPVAFHYYGAVYAGQVGITLQIMWAVQSVGYSWITSKVPDLGRDAKSGRLEELTHKVSSGMLGSIVITLILCIGFITALIIMNYLDHDFLDRFVSIQKIFTFAVGIIAFQYVIAKNAHVRAFGVDKFYLINTIAALSIVFLLLALPTFVGVWGITLAYTVSVIFISVPLTMYFWNAYKPEFVQIELDRN